MVVHGVANPSSDFHIGLCLSRLGDPFRPWVGVIGVTVVARAERRRHRRFPRRPTRTAGLSRWPG